MGHSEGLGDVVAFAFATVGITKGRTKAFAKALGLEDCACEKRQEMLNRLGRDWLVIGPKPPADSKIRTVQ